MQTATSLQGEGAFETKAHWGHTRQRVELGQVYRVKVEWHQVIDGNGWMGIPVRSLNGWPFTWRNIAAAPLAWLRRRPFDPWFSLIGTVDCKKPFRLLPGEPPPDFKAEENISWSLPFTAPACGELVCYFNDVPWAYYNNHGWVIVRLHTDPVEK